jgi:hypothetical protein
MPQCLALSSYMEVGIIENVDDDILTTQCSPRPHIEERKGLETGLIAVIASSTLALEVGGGG